MWIGLLVFKASICFNAHKKFSDTMGGLILVDFVNQALPNHLKTLIVSYSDTMGGASKAAHRLHRAFRSMKVCSTMLVSEKSSDDRYVVGPESYSAIARSMLLAYAGWRIAKTQKTNDTGPHSLNVFPWGLFKAIKRSDAEIVNLHWINRESLSIEQVARIRKPLVFTLHDMWAFCGAEHYGSDNPESRFIAGYNPNNRHPGDRGIDLDRWVWNRKKTFWIKPHHVICPSNWLADCARSSQLMKDWPVHVIPNAIDLECFKPLDKMFCRKALGINPDVVVVAFGAIKGTKDFRKGFDLLVSAIRLLSVQGYSNETEYIVFGQSEPNIPLNLSATVKYMGYLHDDWTLALLYNSADVMVVPSRQEAFGQTASEAQACGCPVVAFNSTGLRDVVEDRMTGYLAEPFSPEDLANGIRWVLQDSSRGAELSDHSRKRALRLWTPEKIVGKYLDVFHRAVRDCRN